MSRIKDAVDALEQHEELEQRRRTVKSTRFPPLVTVGYASVWAPTMTEQQRIKHEQYVKEHQLPF